MDFEVYHLAGYILAADIKAHALASLKARFASNESSQKLARHKKLAGLVEKVYEDEEAPLEEIGTLLIMISAMGLHADGIESLSPQMKTVMAKYEEFSVGVLEKYAVFHKEHMKKYRKLKSANERLKARNASKSRGYLD